MRRRFAIRAAVIFGVWGAALALFYGALVIGLAQSTEKRLLEDVLAKEAASLGDLEAHADEEWRPINPLVDTAADLAELEKRLPDDFDPSASGFQVLEDANGDTVYALSVAPDDPAERRVLFLSTSETRSVTRHIESYVRFLAFVVLGAIVVTAGTSFLVGRAIARPITTLSGLVTGKPLAAVPAGLARGFGDDEVGALAGVIDTSLADARAALERERQFNRGVSHELRSALQVADHAAELLHLNADAPPSRDVLARLDRALETMRASAEAFLWLARPPDAASTDERVALADAARRVVDRHAGVAAAHDVAITTAFDPDVTVAAPRAVVDVITANLLRNAVRHARRAVQVSVDADGLVVADDGDGLDPEQQAAIADGRAPETADGFGLGLVLCRRLCERFGWALDIDSDGPGRGTRARVRV